jgi:DNA-binding MarR family transcriptional regulator
MPKRSSSMQSEIQQRRPFRSPSEEAMVALMRTGSLVERLVARAVESAGISQAQYNVLRILRGAGSQGLPTLTIRDRLVREAPGITRLVDKLERAGFVRRVRQDGDRRLVYVHVTRLGLSVLERLDVQIYAADRQALHAMPKADLVALNRLLDKARTHLYRAEGVAAGSGNGTRQSAAAGRRRSPNRAAKSS